jgi:hypothetical protein
MARALTAGELADLRSDNQFSELFLAIHAPNTVLSAQVDGDPASDDSLVSLSIDNVSWGSGYTSAPADLLVYVGSSEGAYDKGMCRLRGALSGTPSSMTVGEISEIEWADDDYLTVVDEFPIAARHLRIASSVVYMDYDVAYSDQHENPDPIPVLGPDAVAWLDQSFTPNPVGDASDPVGADSIPVGDAADDYAEVDFDASDSWVPGGGSITTYAWDAQGEYDFGPVDSATPTGVWNTAGIYRIECTVTADNGSTFTGYRYVYVYDDSNPPTTQFTLENCSGSWQRGGWTFRVRLYAGATRASDIRDRARVILFARDYYDGALGSIGPVSDRENIVAVGWIDGESIEWDPETGSVTFDVLGPQGWLAKANAYASGIEDVASTPSAWTEYQGLDLEAALWHWARWRTTLPRLLDVYLDDDARLFSVFSVPQGVLWQQLVAAAQSTILAHSAFDRYGRLFVYVEPQVVPSGDRSGWPTVHTLSSQDLRRPVGIERRLVSPVAQIDLSGIHYTNPTTAEPLFSLAPGHVPKWYGEIQSYTRLALTDQSQTNTLAGLILAWQNNEYPAVRLPLASNHRGFDIAPYQRAVLSLSAGDTPRGIVWSGQNLLVREMSLSYNHRTGVLLTDLMAEAETDETGVPVQDGDVPSDPPGPAPPPSSPPPFDPTPPDPTLGSGEAVGVAGVGGFFWTDEILSESSPTWTKFTAGLGDDTFVRSLCADPLRPTYAACIDDGGNVYVTTDWRSGSNWSSALTVAAATDLIEAATGAGEGEITNVELVAVYSFAKDADETGTLLVLVQFDWDETGGEIGAQVYKTRVIRSSTWGSSWTCGGEIVSTTYGVFVYKSWNFKAKEPGGDYGYGELAFDGANLIIVAGMMKSGGGLTQTGINYSPDWGATWQSSPSMEDERNINRPRCGRCDGNGRLYIAWWQEDSGGNGADYVYTENLISRTKIADLDDTSQANWVAEREMLELLCDNTRVELDATGGDTKIYVGGVLASTISEEVHRCVKGFELDADVGYVGRSYRTGEDAGEDDTEVVYVTEDQFTNVSNKTGNLYSLGCTGISNIICDWSSD